MGNASSSPKTILFLSFAFHAGGIERMLVDLTSALASRGHRILLVIINRDYDGVMIESVDPRVRCIRMNRRAGSRTQDFYMRALERIVREQNVSIIHCQDLDGVLFSSFAKMMHPSLRIVHTVHNRFELTEEPAWKKAVTKRISCATIAISKSVSDDVKKYLSRSATLIYNGIDTTRFVPVRREDGVAGETHSLTIGCVCRIHPEQKGLDLLVQAVERLRAEHPDIRCEIAGALYKGQAEAFEELTQYVADHGLNDAVRFIGHVEDVASFLQTLDVFVLPSRTEGFGIALVEALSCGVPCVASDTGGLREILTDASYGALFASGSADALEQALRRVMEQRASYDPAVLHRYVEEHFSLERLVEAHEGLYERL